MLLDATRTPGKHVKSHSEVLRGNTEPFSYTNSPDVKKSSQFPDSTPLKPETVVAKPTNCLA